MASQTPQSSFPESTHGTMKHVTHNLITPGSHAPQCHPVLVRSSLVFRSFRGCYASKSHHHGFYSWKPVTYGTMGRTPKILIFFGEVRETLGFHVSNDKVGRQAYGGWWFEL